ncbi:MAG TPA: A/G-specific adenine glycosylase, partial [Chryseolinea sp.]|nr:A/G-specific adenine glycosylase [Chryseolinea sp.]
MDKRYFSDKVVEWYESNKRDLPWRETRDPYKIWLSEVILQQTRVNQGLPYYLRFIEKFPNVKSLANASEQEVLRQWQGLGYYTRARNLHKCAQQVVAQHESKFPDSFESLKKLAGIGEYTAAAIASIAFKQNVAVVDGNVFRVLSRIFGLSDEINSPQGRKLFKALANDLIDNRHPDLHNQAMMEFGALYCTPKNPACTLCIFAVGCFAAQKNMQHALPVKAGLKAPRKRYFYYLVVKKGRTLLMNKRGSRDIWNGMYDFCLTEKEKPLPLKALVQYINLSTCSNIKPENAEISTEYK